MQEIEELERKLNNKQLDGIYLLYGEERFLLENILKKIKKCFGEMINGINYIQIDADTINQLVSDIETPAFGYPKKLIIAKDTGLFQKPKRGKKKDDTQKEKQEKKAKKAEEKPENKLAEYIKRKYRFYK